VVCGHHHRPIQTRWSGTLGVVAPSTAHQVVLDLREGKPTRFVMEPPGLVLHLWRDGVTDPDYPGRKMAPTAAAAAGAPGR